ncbi:MAG: hypothetical protein AB1411_07140 [Nitrospirota bacterium]
MEPTSPSQPGESSTGLPTKEELQAELLNIPEPSEAPRRPAEASGFDQVLAASLRHVRGKRGGDLLAVILVGSGARRALTPHSDLDLIAVVKGQDEGQEIVRIADRLVEIRYRGHKTVEQEIGHVPRLPPLLRKGRILYEQEAAGSRLIEKAGQRFRQGPPPASLNEKIRLKAECFHWLGKAEDLAQYPATAQYLLGLFFESLVQAFFRLRGFWPTSPADTLRFVSSRDATVGGLLERLLTLPTLEERLAVGKELADVIFRDVPNPARID